MFIGQGLSLKDCRAAQAERQAANTASAAVSAVAAAAAASTVAAAASERASLASPPLITIMASNPLPKCPVLPDGCVFTSAFVGMNENRFSSISMFANDVQVLCASGSDCKVHCGAGPVGSSIHRCMNCALKFHSCITCSGVRFSDWISGAATSFSENRYLTFSC